MAIGSKKERNMKTLFYNGTILKMDDTEEEAQAVIVEGSRIKAVGDYDRLRELAGEEALHYDLEGRTLMPAFIDSHSHITMAAQMLDFADLSDTSSFLEIVDVLRQYAAARRDCRMILGFGYDHNTLQEEGHPDKFILDEVSGELPVMIMHVSGHMGVMNSKGLELAGINAGTKDPEGGRFGRLSPAEKASSGDAGAGGQEPDGYLEEAAMMQVQMLMAGNVKVDIAANIRKAQDLYLSYGITTAQDGASTADTVRLLAAMGRQGLLKMDVVSYLVMADDTKEQMQAFDEYLYAYKGHFRIGGCKLILDGSPQGRSAWLTKPYENEESYRGYPWLPDEQVLSYCKEAVENEWQILAHCNGDAAGDQFLSCYEKAVAQVDSKGTDLRPVMIHCQTARGDQLKKMAELGMAASVFVGHVWYWGDVHIKNLGEERGRNISPVSSALKEGLCVTLHQDTPVTKPDMLHSVWCAVNRVSRNGRKLNQEECISVYDALKAVTIQAAYQYHEEKEKGSIEEGKKADIIILSDNPLSVPREHIKDIRVELTMKEGEVLYAC